MSLQPTAMSLLQPLGSPHCPCHNV